MPIATNGNGNGHIHEAGSGEGAAKAPNWLAANDVTAEVGGQANVDYLKRVSFDFSST
jgi:hypothetical protein